MSSLVTLYFKLCSLVKVIIFVFGILSCSCETYVLQHPISNEDNSETSNSAFGLQPPSDEITLFDTTFNVEDEYVNDTFFEKLAFVAKKGRKGTTNKKPPKHASAKAKRVVEIAVFADPFLYNKLKNKFPTDTDNNIKQYILTLVNTMNVLYNQPSLKVPVTIKLVHLEIQQIWPLNLPHQNGEVNRYLDSFCDYAGSLNTDNKRWDHGMMLTGTDIHDRNDKSIAGVAYAETMCNRYYSCSLNEASDFGSVFVMTHELGHSLGMEHDGDGVSKACHRAKFIMAAYTGAGQVTWSSCSRKNLQDFLQYGTAAVRNKGQHRKPSCLTAQSAKAKIGIAYSSTVLPGQKYNAVVQCSFFMGSSFTPYSSSKEPFNNICGMLHCTNKVKIYPAHPALEGTPCGAANSQCRRGKCVPRT